MARRKESGTEGSAGRSERIYRKGDRGDLADRKHSERRLKPD